MTEISKEPAPACGMGPSGLKCAVVSWAAPLAATVVLAIGMRYPQAHVFNILFVAFGITALLRSVDHTRTWGPCGLGGHIVAGALLNLCLLALLAAYIFTGLDPLGLRP